MARVSVVVPIYNVERYVGECLQSIADQTFRDLEVVMVDDGSTDGSAAVAEEFAQRDSRFRLVSQANGGLSAARNTGLDEASGEFLVFADSDDLVPARAYELLLGALDETGSDFATGNFHYLTPGGIRRRTWASDAFRRTRLATHITQFWPLLADRTAWNKLWRRSFWDEQSFRFPEGKIHEDIPVSLPAHFKARSVDVIAEPVYYYRSRSGEGLSITQRRLEPKALRDRLDAVTSVSDFLAREGERDWKRRYDASVLGDDLRYHVNLLDRADERYRETFLEGASAFLDRASPHILDALPAIERLKWHLVRRRLMPELLEVLRFQSEDLTTTPPVRVRGRWYGDYPFRTDRRLRVPRSVYRLDQELELVAEMEDLRLDGDHVRLDGYAYISGIGAPAPSAERVRVAAAPSAVRGRVRRRLAEVSFETSVVERPDLVPVGDLVSDPTWSGFSATVPMRAFRRWRSRWREGTWNVGVIVRAGRNKRRLLRFRGPRLRPLRGGEVSLDSGVLGRAVPTPTGGVAVEVRRQWATVRSQQLVDDGTLEVAGDLLADGGAELTLEVAQRGGSLVYRYPLEIEAQDGSSAQFRVSVPVADVIDAPEPARRETAKQDDRGVWGLKLAGDDDLRLPLLMPADGEPGTWRFGATELSLFRTKRGEAALVRRGLRPLVTSAGWTESGALELAGELPADLAVDEVVLVSRREVVHHRFPIRREPGDRFAATLTPAAIESLAGVRPLSATTWDLRASAAGDPDEDAMVPVALADELHDSLPLAVTLDRKPFSLGAAHDGRAILVVQLDLDGDERGRFRQHLLREGAYRSRRNEPLRDAVVYTSFGGLEYSDGPRAIHEELVRRGAPLDHLWMVWDARARVPEGATALRYGSREHFDAVARARFVVTNDILPEWFVRRPDQVCVQTWHGTPLKPVGTDMAAPRPWQRRLNEQAGNWQYLVSPSAFATPILRRAFDFDREVLELGYPRSDSLAGPDRDARTQALRRRLGVPEGKRVVLYAPTYREHAAGSRGGFRLDLHLDLVRLRQAVGSDSVVLFRKHPRVSDVVPTMDGFVYDVSTYPDATELLLAADVLVTDYSSVMFDFANTGRPMLFFAYDLDAYRDDIESYYVDYLETIPGPLLQTTGDVAEALQDIDAVRRDHDACYSAFVSEYCALDDGHASARVVDRLFGH